MKRTEKFLIVLGTRPEAIKLAPLILELRRRAPGQTVVCATGQHREMVGQALGIFGITPDVDLETMRRGRTLAATSAAILQGIERTIAKLQPQWVLVQGDTITASMAALCAFYRRTRIGHVEAGLRTGDLCQPFPEELNRRIAGLVADQHFAPTAAARSNLLREGVPANKILLTGNTGIDALHRAVKILRTRKQLPRKRRPGTVRVLITAHRRENQDGGILGVCRAVQRICGKWGETVEVVWPVHPNPRVAGPVRRALAKTPQVRLIAPLAYEEMVRELYYADVLATDSGGLQEEAPALGKRVLVLRNTTERPEGVEAGVAELIGTDEEAVFRAIDLALKNESGRIARISPYGDGKASARIADFLLGRRVRDEFGI